MQIAARNNLLWIATRHSSNTVQANRLFELYKNGKLQVVTSHTKIQDDFNSTRSLPMVEFPKNRIFTEVENDTKVGNWRKPITKYYRLGISLLKFYRDGIQNTYAVYRDSRRFLKGFGSQNYKDAIPSMLRIIESQELQLKRNVLTNNTNDLAFKRADLVEMMRRNEIYKLPNFFIICLVFEELTAVLCYFFPQVAPRNCMTPGGYFKISNKKIEQFKKLTREVITDSEQYLPPYALSNSQIYGIIKNSEMPISRGKLYLRNMFNIKDKLIQDLTIWYQYIYIDDWYLVTTLLKGKELRLDRSELVNCIYERKLYQKGENLNEMMLSKEGTDTLVRRLIDYWSYRFGNTIIIDGKLTFNEKWGITNLKSMLPENTLTIGR
ncbi:uncharacterized protein GVI51_C02673 [Nakaseomyces glabratus]|uniref:Pentamidine resistance factor, mitochondrial n=2 Tax=Candida glabrata TaxID=5478 RepID=Q6FWU2_CANGA|nr:uncharacterized protein CAGL0C02871g [Nakaseomyces glabratus]KAH7590158.1 hypothetical protein J7298_00543 [Nakaseomyces glabratus]KAH7607858.1 hypothetical protein J7295_00544 [Nakaseomyces glabratus]KAH7608641.1 hypothetical protein J7293_00546 [Nakaseomyces glabratus]KAH7609516.1 hypothetical protein J7294_00547 [Nakaseomyces glabratus]KAH7615009.1 hypothetical protein J7292_00541 [Nakaseomyces glabratus]|eukprot:XP_445302.1 uncharacterized protein CAGL0C02871g [[Candida] glabrata]